MKKTTLVTLALVFTSSLFTSCAGTSTPNSDLPENSSSQVAETSITSTAIVEVIPEATTEPSVEPSETVAETTTVFELPPIEERFEINTDSEKLLKFDALNVSEFGLDDYGSIMTSLAAWVNYYGFEETPFTLFEYMPKTEISDPISSFTEQFVGTDLTKMNYGCFYPGVEIGMNEYINANNINNFILNNLYESAPSTLYDSINNGIPVVVWICKNLSSLSENGNYIKLDEANAEQFYCPLTTVAVLVGYDSEFVYLAYSNNPTGEEIQKYSKLKFEENWVENYAMALTITEN